MPLACFWFFDTHKTFCPQMHTNVWNVTKLNQWRTWADCGSMFAAFRGSAAVALWDLKPLLIYWSSLCCDEQTASPNVFSWAPKCVHTSAWGMLILFVPLWSNTWRELLVRTWQMCWESVPERMSASLIHTYTRLLSQLPHRNLTIGNQISLSIKNGVKGSKSKG